ncbi:MAG TPA: DUF6338 family protein [Alphaproteobacteria bacterium]
MKLEDVPNLYFVVSVFVPGFIYHGILSNLVPLREHGTKELILLRLLTATAFNYAVCSPLIYLLVTGDLFADAPGWRAIAWMAIIFVVPIGIALVSAAVAQHDGVGWLLKWLRLRSINPVPTGWDWIFSRTEPCFVLVTLRNRTQIAGYFGENSMASSDPVRRDLYLERLYTIPPGNQPWQTVHNSLGMYIAASDISFIEFKR